MCFIYLEKSLWWFWYNSQKLDHIFSYVHSDYPVCYEDNLFDRLAHVITIRAIKLKASSDTKQRESCYDPISGKKKFRCVCNEMSLDQPQAIHVSIISGGSKQIIHLTQLN